MSLKSRTKALEKRLEKLAVEDGGGTCPRCGKPEGPRDLDSPEGVELLRGYLTSNAQRQRDGQEPEDFEAYCLARFCGCEGGRV